MINSAGMAGSFLPENWQTTIALLWYYILKIPQFSPRPQYQIYASLVRKNFVCRTIWNEKLAQSKLTVNLFCLNFQFS